MDMEREKSIHDIDLEQDMDMLLHKMDMLAQTSSGKTCKHVYYH